MVLRILFRKNAKKYPQNTFRVHNREVLVLCTLLMVLFSFYLTASQFIQSVATTEQLDIEHQLIPGSHTQLLIDAAVVLFYCMDADKGKVGNIRRIMAFDVIVQNPPLRGGEGFDLFREPLEQILHAGRQRAGTDLPGIQLRQHLYTDDLSAGLDNAVVPEHTVKQ